MQSNPATIGDNNPPDETEIQRLAIAGRQAITLANTSKLLESATRAPAAITTEEEAEQVTALIKLLTTNAKALENAFDVEKAPYLNGGRVVDNFFKFHRDKVATTKKTMSEIMTAWLTKKAKEEQARLAEAARVQREQAERELQAAVTLEQQGMAQFSESALAQSVITQDNANKLEASAAAKPAHLASTRSVGATASLRTVWKGTVTDVAALNLEALRPYIAPAALQAAVDAFVRAGGRALLGASIREESSANVR